MFSNLETDSDNAQNKTQNKAQKKRKLKRKTKTTKLLRKGVRDSVTYVAFERKEFLEMKGSSATRPGLVLFQPPAPAAARLVDVNLAVRYYTEKC